MRNRWDFVSILAAALCVAGCRTTDSSTSRERAADLPPLPYAVRIDPVRFPEVKLGGHPTLGFQESRRIQQRLVSALQDGLESSSAFARVTSPTAQHAAVGVTPAVDKAADDADLVLEITALVDEGRGLPEHDLEAGKVAGSAFLWLYGIVPAWFVSDRTYDPVLRASLVLSRGGSQPALARTFDPGPMTLRFWERVGGWKMAATLVTPPAILPTDDAGARRLLIDRTIDLLAEESIDYLKRRLALDQLNASEPFFAPPGAAGEGAYLLVSGRVATLNVDGSPLGDGTDPDAQASFLAERELQSADKLVRLQGLRAWLERIDPTADVPSIEALDRRYEKLYRLDGIALRDEPQRIELTYHMSGDDGASTAVRWTLPAAVAAPDDVARP